MFFNMRLQKLNELDFIFLGSKKEMVSSKERNKREIGESISPILEKLIVRKIGNGNMRVERETIFCKVKYDSNTFYDFLVKQLPLKNKQ